MGNSVFLDVRFKDFTGSVLKKIESATGVTFQRVNKTIGTTQTKLNDLGKPVRVQMDTTEITRASREMDRLNSKAQSMRSGGGGPSLGRLASGSFYGNLAARGVEMGARTAYDELKSVLSSGMDAAAIKAQFGVLARDKKAGSNLFTGLTKYIQDSPFGPEQYDNAKTMLAYRVALNKVIPDMKMLGEVAMFDTEKMKSLTYAFSQTNSFGKLRGNEMLQYADAGFNPAAIIGEKLGKSAPEMDKLISAGRISAKMVEDALVTATSPGGQFFGMQDEMMLQNKGKLDAMMGSLESAKMGLGLSLEPAIAKVINESKPIVDDMPATLAAIKPQLDEIITGFADMVRWTRTHTDTIKTWAGFVKVGVEGYAAWKLGAVGLTAATWLMNASVGAAATQTAAVISEEKLLTAELLEQTSVVEANELAWLSMSKSQLAAMDAMAAKAASLPIVMNGTAAAAGAGAAGMAGGMAAAVTSTMIPVMIGAFGGQALAQWMGAGKKGSAFQNATGYDDQGQSVEWWDVIGKNDWKKKLAALRRSGYSQDEAIQYGMTGNNPRATDSGVNMGFLNSMGLGAGTNQDVLDKYGVAQKPGKDLAKAVETMTDSIIGGGQKAVNINFKNFVENLKIQAADIKNGVDQTEDQLEEMWVRLLRSAEQAIG